MGKRGRPSIASLMVPHNLTEIISAARGALRSDRRASRRMAGNRWYDGSGHFMRGHHPLLAQLCRHTVNARRIAQLIEQCVKEKEFNRKEYGILLQLEAI